MKKRFSGPQIVAKLRQADKLLGQGKTVEEVCKEINVADVTYYRWRQKYGGMSPDMVKQLRAVQKENVQLHKLVADQGNENCIRTFREVGRILAVNIEKTLRENGIQCLLFGGQISRSFRHMEDALKHGLKNVESMRRISEVKNIDNAALLGAFGKFYKAT